MLRSDSKLLGLLLGLVLPLVGIMLFWTVAPRPGGLTDITALADHPDVVSAVISIGLLANLPAFFIFYRKKWDESARGVIMATFLYAVPIVYIKFML
ncbi:MAG: hypothetical protein K9J06_14325 [Flavobacteriales bacterium]|nr:hypothetical protein [Flavobacteriales bacterium]